MLGSVLKELFPALGRYIGYRLGRMVGRGPRGRPASDPASPHVIVQPQEISQMDDSAGLDASYLKNVSWRTDRRDESELGLAENPVYRLWRGIPQGLKWSQYFEAYESLFGPRRDKPLRILEIGIFRGASLRLWRQYFHHPETVIVGIDIDADCRRHDAAEKGIHVRIGSQADAAFLQQVVNEFGPFDLIIDDGSHHSTHMIASFNALYRDGLKDGGIYFAEDLHANYWRPWRDSRRSFLDLCKELAELLHAHYTKAWLLDWNQEGADPDRPVVVEVPEITLMIKEIRILDSMVAIYKARRTYMPRSTTI